MAFDQAVVFHQGVVACALAALMAIGGLSLDREQLLVSAQMRKPQAHYDAARSSLVAARSTMSGFSNGARQRGGVILVTGSRCPEEKLSPAATPPYLTNFAVAFAADPGSYWPQLPILLP